MNPPKIKSHVQKRGTQPKIFHHKNTERYLKREPEEEGRGKKSKEMQTLKKKKKKPELLRLQRRRNVAEQAESSRKQRKIVRDQLGATRKEKTSLWEQQRI